MNLKQSLVCLTSLLLVNTAYSVATTAPSMAAPFQSNEQTNINVYRNASPAVVTIIGGNNTGSGSIISPEGLVITNEHVVRAARSGMVSVQTSNGQRYTGQVIATDAANDLALIQLRTNERLPFIRLAASDGIQIGQQVFAIGSPFGLSGTLTTGILSRIAPNGDLQTDAVLNPGNSGGPLLNSQGELIGVNKAILANQGSNTGIGFATSALVAQHFVNQVRTGRPSSPVNPAIATAPPTMPQSVAPSPQASVPT
ncbi:S1C family serine protease, partial [Trichothermofontia sp.]